MNPVTVPLTILTNYHASSSNQKQQNEISGDDVENHSYGIEKIPSHVQFRFGTTVNFRVYRVFLHEDIIPINIDLGIKNEK